MKTNAQTHRPTAKLASAFRDAAKRIEDPNGEYDWTKSNTCNCGILAREITRCDDVYALGFGRPKYEFIDSTHCVWSVKGLACSQTGMEIPEVFSALSSVGINIKSLVDIESCQNISVLTRIGASTWDGLSERANPSFVARYFRAWADMIDEQLAEQANCTTSDQEPRIEVHSREMRPVTAELMEVAHD